MAARGRPRNPKESEKKIAAVSLRMRPALRALIEAASKKNKRSLNEEIESRLEQSFAPGPSKAIFGGDENFALCVLIGTASKEAEQLTGSRWWNDLYTWESVRDAIVEVLDHFRPTGPREIPDSHLVLRSVKAARPKDEAAARQKLLDDPQGKKAGKGAIAQMELAGRAPGFPALGNNHTYWWAARKLRPKLTKSEWDNLIVGAGQ